METNKKPMSDKNSKKDFAPTPKRLLRRFDDGGGSSSSSGPNLYQTAMAYAPAAAALSHGKGYVPSNAASYEEMKAFVAAVEAEASLDVGPSPTGTSSPDTRGGDDFQTRRKANRLNPNISPKTDVYPDGSKEVILEANHMHAYMTRGKINGETVLFLLDTGATQVSIPEPVANRLGLKGSGRSSMVQTASGTVSVQEVYLDTLSVGEIELSFVPAVINPADRGDTILLGMSALKRIQFTHDDGKLILKQKP